jgi:Protein of unknown function (DUF1554)
MKSKSRQNKISQAELILLFVISQGGLACGRIERDFGSQSAGGPSEAGAAGAEPAGTAGDGGASTQSSGGEAGTDVSEGLCGNGTRDPGEQCDDGSENDAAAYGNGKCTNLCQNAPYCGDGIKNNGEVCDNGGTGAFNLGDCNPECTGFYEKKMIRATDNMYPAGGLGGPAGADAKCVLEFGAGWKALLVGGGRRATTTPFLGDDPSDWVIHKFTYYYSYFAQSLMWRTDSVPLLGVLNGSRLDLYADAFLSGGNYPWSGWQTDWTTFDVSPSSGPPEGTCDGWTSTTAGWGSFALSDLTPGASEGCASSSFILCVEQ